VRNVYISPPPLYISSMPTISASDARKSFAAVIETAQHEAVLVERRGELQAVVLSVAEYERLMDAAEEAEDVRAFDEAMAEEGPDIPWEQVKNDLGW
jgi:antitoxin Phd